MSSVNKYFNRPDTGGDSATTANNITLTASSSQRPPSFIQSQVSGRITARSDEQNSYRDELNKLISHHTKLEFKFSKTNSLKNKDSELAREYAVSQKEAGNLDLDKSSMNQSSNLPSHQKNNRNKLIASSVTFKVEIIVVVVYSCLTLLIIALP